MSCVVFLLRNFITLILLRVNRVIKVYIFNRWQWPRQCVPKIIFQRFILLKFRINFYLSQIT